MSTRSRITLRRKDLTETSIYCHWDGYVEGNGIILQLAYNTADKVEKLLALGDISILGYYTEPDPSKGHDFENHQEGVCVAYHRDRGEEFHQSAHEQEYNYMFDEYDGVWYVSSDKRVEDSEAGKLLGMGSIYVLSQRLLLDAIINEVDWDEIRWRDDEFAKAGEVVEACIEKAKEGRKQSIYNRGW